MLRAVIVGSALLAAACGRTGLLGEGESVGGSGSGSGGAAGGRGGGGGLSGVSGNDVGGGSPATGGAAGDGGSAGAPMSSPLRIGPELLPDARVRWDYRTTLTARGGAGAPYTFTLVGVPLPPGLALASANGWLAGIPTRVGDYPVRVQVRDAAGAMATRDYVLRVVPPRFLAVYTFVSSSSSRTAINLVDLIRPDLPMYTVADGSLSNNAFSPDGRWLAYCDHVQHMGQGQLFLVDTTGDKPGPPLPVLEAGETSECTAWAWSPDSQQLAYVREGTLFIADVRETGVFERTERVQGVSRLGLRWVAPDLIFLRDEQGRARLLELDPPVGAIKSVNLEPSTLLSASPNRELVFGSTGSGYFLADATTGNAEELGPWSAWNVSPTFELLVGRSAMGEFALYSPSQATLPAPLRVGTGALGRSAAFGRVRPALLQREHDHLVMSELRAGALEVQPVSGAYGAPTGFGFDSEDEVVVLTDRDSLWLSDTTAAGPLTAHAASQVGRDPAFQLASSSRQLVAAGGDPYAVQLIEFRDPKKPVVSPVNVDLLWSELGWSPDDTHLALYGGSSSLGRPLYVVTADRPGAAKVVVSCSGNGGSVPRCPGGFKFQP